MSASKTLQPYTKANGKPILPRPVPNVIGWRQFYSSRGCKLRRTHLLMEDGSMACGKTKGMSPGDPKRKETRQCKFCRAVELRYMAEAGEDLYIALSLMVKDSIFGRCNVPDSYYMRAIKALLKAEGKSTQ